MHEVLSGAGYIFDAADLLDALVYVFEGDFKNAAEVAGVLAGAKKLADAAFEGRKAAKAAKAAEEVADKAARSSKAGAKTITEGAGDVAAKAGNKTIVIGETMERVKKYAAEIGAETYKEFKYYEKTKAMFGTKLADFIGGVDNALWLIGKMVQKYKIVDLGLDMKRLERSPYYLMESVLAYLYKYKDYAEDFMKGAF